MQRSASPDSKSFDAGLLGQSLAVRPDKRVLMLYRARGELASAPAQSIKLIHFISPFEQKYRSAIFACLAGSQGLGATA